MLKTQRLLVPVDFSPSSKLALEQGAALANSQDAELDVLHVWELPAFVAASEVAEDAGLAPAILDSISKNAYSLTERFAAEARDNGVAIHRARALAGASVYETIIEQADRGGYDMIVIGSHGRSGWSRLVIGSVAERVVRHAHCPVLVARAQPVAVANQRKRFLVAIDFSSSSELAIETAAALAERAGADIDLLHVWDLPMLSGPHDAYVGAAFPTATIDALRDDATRALDRVTADARARGIAIREARAIAGAPSEVIVEEATQGHYAMVVVGTHGRRGVSRALLGSVAERVVRYAPCPVLVARAQRGSAVANATAAGTA